MTNHSIATAKVIPFKFDAREVRAYVDESGEPWFCAADVCAALGYANSRKAISDNCRKAGVTVSDISSGGQMRRVTFINEGNLYRLIIKSRKEEAQRFESWVCDEVLPSIRRQGRYEDTNNKMATLVGQTIGTNGFNCLSAVLDGKLRLLKGGAKRAAKNHVWQQVHRAFSVVRAEDIPAEQLDSARCFIAAYDVREGDWIPSGNDIDLSMSLKDWIAVCPITRNAQKNQPSGRMLLTAGLIADMDTAKPLDRLLSKLKKQGVDVSAYDTQYHFLLEYLRENRRSLKNAIRCIEGASENHFAFWDKNLGIPGA